MKKFISFVLFLTLSLVCVAQNTVYEVSGYSRYVSSPMTYPVLIPDSTTTIIEYVVKDEVGIVHRDTLDRQGSFNVTVFDTSRLVCFSVFNYIEMHGLKIINWIGIYPDGNSNVLLIFDDYKLCCKYDISDERGKVYRKGKFKNNMASESLVGMPNDIYYLEITTCAMKCVIEMQVSVNQY